VNETHCITWRSGKLGKLGKLAGKLLRKNVTAEPTVEPTVAAQIMFVGPRLHKCADDASVKCLVTKFAKAADFVAELDAIDGFDFVPGFDYKLSVRPQRVKAGTIKYVLISVKSKTPAKSKGKAPSPAPNSCAEVACMMFCDNGYKKDNQGCEICSCLPSPVKTCPDVTCDNLCPHGYSRNSAGCATCGCAPVTATLIPSLAFNCNSAADWTLAKVAACCVPPPPVGSAVGALCSAGLQSGFVSLPVN